MAAPECDIEPIHTLALRCLHFRCHPASAGETLPCLRQMLFKEWLFVCIASWGGQLLHGRNRNSHRCFRNPSGSDALPGRGQLVGGGLGAVIGGAFVAAALYLILLALGAGFELSTISPWANRGLSPATAVAAAVTWLIVIEIVSSAMGGYLAGRLRTKWTMVHNDEVFFRDTANGFLSWAVALVVSVTLMASAASSMVGRISSSRESTASPISTAEAPDPNAYFVDALFRSDRATLGSELPVHAEAGRILANALRERAMPATDQDYLSRLVAAHTGLSQSDAQKRVSDVVAEARQAEDTARKVTAHFLLWLFLALLAGAFSASYAATIGGRQRDHVKAI